MGNSRPYDPYDQTTWYNDDGTARKNPYNKNNKGTAKGKSSGKGPGRTRGTSNIKRNASSTADWGKIYNDSRKYLDPEYFFGVGSSKIVKKGPKKVPTGGGDNNTPKAEVYARPIVPISQIQVPIGSGQAITPNMQEAYIKEVTRLTLNLISSADNLLFAYNFSTIDRIASYMLEVDDASQRSTGVVSNIRRAIEGVPLTELEIRDRLNGVINLVANTIGDLVPSDRKLNLFGSKKDNLPFQGGMPRINNRTSFYDLELDLPELSSPEYSVTYVIKCYDIS